MARWILALTVAGAAWSANAPRKAPDLQIHLADGKNLSLSEFRGKKVCAVVFISTTCPHCQAYVGVLNGIQKDYAARGVQVVVVAFNDGAAAALPAFIQQFKPAFPLGWQDHAAVLGFMQISILNPGFVPKVAFIDRNGAMFKEFPHQDAMDSFFNDSDIDKNTRAALDAMLKAPATTTRKAPATSTAKKAANTAQK